MPEIVLALLPKKYRCRLYSAKHNLAITLRKQNHILQKCENPCTGAEAQQNSYTCSLYDMKQMSLLAPNSRFVILLK